MDISLSPYILAFAVLLVLGAVLWTISCYGSRRAKSGTISHFKKFAEQCDLQYSCSTILDYDRVKGVNRNRSFEFKLYELRGAWLLLRVLLSKQSDFYLRIARKSIRETVFKGRETGLETGCLSDLLESMLALKTDDPKKTQMLLDSDTQSIALKFFEELKIARLEIDKGELRVTISDPEITGEGYFISILEITMDFADRVEKKI